MNYNDTLLPRNSTVVYNPIHTSHTQVTPTLD